uniref:Stomatal closure-related actin-binding protein actin-binding domain-containing protein n=1 Tax=Zea mays TaxID=4577 RepID=A0A804NBY8_MAIZE
MPPIKEIVAKKITGLLDHCHHLFVREHAMKFEKGLNTAMLLSNELNHFLALPTSYATVSHFGPGSPSKQDSMATAELREQLNALLSSMITSGLVYE